MDNSIGTPHWMACETCKHGGDGSGCTVGVGISIDYDATHDVFICEDYEKEREDAPKI